MWRSGRAQQTCVGVDGGRWNPEKKNAKEYDKLIKRIAVTAAVARATIANSESKRKPQPQQWHELPGVVLSAPRPRGTGRTCSCWAAGVLAATVCPSQQQPGERVDCRASQSSADDRRRASHLGDKHGTRSYHFALVTRAFPSKLGAFSSRRDVNPWLTHLTSVLGGTSSRPGLA